MTTTKERLINFRPVMIVALSFSLSVIFMVGLFSSLFYLIPAILLFLFVLVFSLIKRKYVFAIISLLIYLFGFLVTGLTIVSYSKNFDKESCVIAGRVCEISNSSYENHFSVLLENVSVETEDGKVKLNGKTNFNIYGVSENSISIGDIISAPTKISNVKIIEDGYLNNGYYADDIRYNCSATFTKIIVSDGNPNFFENIKYSTRDNLIKYMGEEEGGISYAVLFGDKSFISYQTTTSFKESGITHILAVSGLNIGFLYALLYFFLDKFKINRWIKFVLLGVCLFCYCLLCDFNPSVVRAAIMCMCLLFTKIIGKQYDAINGLSLSFLLILLFKPLYLYDVGFQLSYGAMLGLILMLRLVDKLNIKNKILKWIVLAVSVSIVSQLGVLPIIAGTFGYLSTYSIIANLVVVPVFAIYYPILCITNLFVMISPIFSFLLIIPTAMVKFTVSFSNIISGLPFAYIKVFGLGTIATILFYFGMFVIGGFINLKGSLKAIFITAVLTTCVMFVSLFNIPNKFTTNNFVILNNAEYYARINTKTNKLFLIDINTTNTGLLERSLKEQKINSVYGLIFTGNTSVSSHDIISFIEDYNVSVIYFPKNHSAINNLLLTGHNVIEMDENKKLYDHINIQTHIFEKGELFEFEIEDKTIIFVNGELSNSNIDYIKQIILKPIELVCFSENVKILNNKEIFNSNNYLYYGEECDIVI